MIKKTGIEINNSKTKDLLRKYFNGEGKIPRPLCVMVRIKEKNKEIGIVK